MEEDQQAEARQKVDDARDLMMRYLRKKGFDDIAKGRAGRFTEGGLVLLGVSCNLWLFKCGTLGLRGGDVGGRVVITGLVA